MLRSILLLALTISIFVILAPAHGQPVQYQFTPPPPIPSLPSSNAPLYPSVPGALPPSPAPDRSHLTPPRVTPSPPLESRSTRIFHTPRGRMIIVPSQRGETYRDRVSNCAAAGAAAGLRPNQMNTFMGRCAN